MNDDIYLKVTFVAREFQVLKHNNVLNNILTYETYIKFDNCPPQTK
jgi:hypothetical protein